MNSVIHIGPEHETAAPFQLEPELATDQRRIAKYLGPAYRITPIGSRRFRCNRYSCPSGAHSTGGIAESLLLRITGTNIEHLGDHEARSDRPRPW
jgi:hypothetical protein